MRRLAACALALCLLAGMAAAEEERTYVRSEFVHILGGVPEVPECEAVEDAYFSRAVFVGDSMADGIAIHNVIPEIQVLGRIGMSPRTARTKEYFKNDGKPVTLARKLPVMRPSAVYLWLGSNGLTGTEAERVIRDYDSLLNQLLRALPDTPFYLLEVTPVAGGAEEGLTNARIDEFNGLLREVAQRHNVYLLPVNALLAGEDGALREEYQAEDGIHLLKPAYEGLAEYMYTHALSVLGE